MKSIYLSRAEIIYPNCFKNSTYDSPSDYVPLLGIFGKILLQVDDDEWQGDSRVLYSKDDKFGILIFGWGSCSGCDSLQACGSYEDINELIDELERSIKWFDSAEDVIYYLENHDWEGDPALDEEKNIEFIRKAVEYLK